MGSYTYMLYEAANNSTVTIPKGRQNIRIVNSANSKNNILVKSYSCDVSPVGVITESLKSTAPIEVGQSIDLGVIYTNLGKVEIISSSVDDTAHVYYY